MLPKEEAREEIRVCSLFEPKSEVGKASGVFFY